MNTIYGESQKWKAYQEEEVLSKVEPNPLPIMRNEEEFTSITKKNNWAGKWKSDTCKSVAYTMQTYRTVRIRMFAPYEYDIPDLCVSYLEATTLCFL
ncbi:hypothetical protein YC2023_054015 [Brassica napus]